MNSKRLKELRKKVKPIQVEWLKSVLPDDQRNKVNIDNVNDLLPEHGVKGVDKKVDVWDSRNKAIWELKNKLPDTDTDFNQIITYFTLMQNEGVKRVITLAVSDNPSDEIVKGINSGFNSVLTSKFSSALNTNENTNSVKWDIIDLRYFDLHRLIP